MGVFQTVARSLLARPWEIFKSRLGLGDGYFPLPQIMIACLCEWCKMGLLGVGTLGQGILLCEWTICIWGKTAAGMAFGLASIQQLPEPLLTTQSHCSSPLGLRSDVVL